MSSPRDRRLTLLCALVIVMPCGAIALIANALAYPLLASAFLLAAIANPRPLAASTRALVYSLTIAALTAYILDLALPIDKERFFFPLIEYIFPFTITLAVCLTFLQPSQLRLALIITLAALAMMIEGSCITNPHDSILAPYGALWRNRFWIYGLFVILQTIVLLPLLLQSQRFGLHRCALPQQRPTSRRIVFLYSLGLLTCFAVVGTHLTLHAERVLEPTFRRLLNLYMELYQPRVVFESSVDLNRKNSSFVSEQAQRIVLRAVADQAPEYLRGRVYESYRSGRWTGIDRNERLHAEHDEALASTRFDRGAPPSNPRVIHIHPASRFYSDVLLASGPTRSIELIAASISTNRNGELQPQSWDRGGSYSLLLPQASNSLAFEGPDLSADPSAYLDVPSDLAVPLKAYADEQFPADLSTAQRIPLIEQHLQARCSYQLGVELDSQRDPVLDFLFHARRGHCELFATAAVMLLRSQGIPARYVTGFACMERHPLEGCFVSRLGDCHAWAEAWLDDEQRWVLVEATPASGLPGEESRSGWLASLFELPRTVLQKLFANIKRGHFAAAVLALFADLGRILAALFWSGPWYLGWGTVLLLGLLTWVWWRRRNPPLAPVYRQFHTVLGEIEKRLHKLGVSRQPNGTVTMLANSARQLRTPQAEQLADLLLRYQTLRFQPDLRAADLEKLRNEVRAD